MAQIMVTPNSVRDTGRRIKSSNNQAVQCLDQIAGSIARLRGSGAAGWESDAAQEFFRKFDELRNRINNHRNIIDQYSNHLDKAAADYEKSDEYAQREAERINVRRNN